MFNVDEENKEFSFCRAKAENSNVFISAVEIRGIYLSLTLGNAKFKQLD